MLRLKEPNNTSIHDLVVATPGCNSLRSSVPFVHLDTLQRCPALAPSFELTPHISRMISRM